MSQQATKSSEGKKGRGPIVMEGITSVAFKKDFFCTFHIGQSQYAVHHVTNV